MGGAQWLRKYRILVVDGSTNAIDVSELRCTFRVVKSLFYPNYSEVTIWNLSQDTFSVMVQTGMRLIIEAGYQDTVYGKGNYGMIYDGDIIQPIWDRPNVVDWTLTLRCIDGDVFCNGNFTAESFKANQDTKAILLAMIANAMTPAAVGYVSPNVETKKLPRGKVFFGEPKYYVRQFAAMNAAQWNVKDSKVNIGKIDDQSVLPDTATVLSPQTGLIGTPQQTQDGVQFRCLLNSQIDLTYPQMLVKVDPKVVIKQAPVIQGQYPVAVKGRLDREGLYKVVRLSHSGDTRGNDWYTDIVGVTSAMDGRDINLFELGRKAF